MKKYIYFLLFFLNIILTNRSNAQKQWCTTDYTVDSITYNPIQPFNVGTQWVVHADTIMDDRISEHIVDSLSTVIPMGFTFNFYNKYYNSVVISKHGYISFDTSLALKPALNCINVTNNSIFLFYIQMQLLKPNLKGTIKYSTIGTSPNRMFVVSYDSVTAAPQWDSSQVQIPPVYSYYTGQIILFENTGTIELHIALATNPYETICNNVTEGIYNSGNIAILGRVLYGNQVNKAIRITQNNIPHAPASPICMVSVDSATGKNMIVWDKPNATGLAIDSFILYKESDVAGVFNRVLAQPYSAYSTYIDYQSNPAQQANRYQLNYRDSCGVLSQFNAAHKTIHLTISQGVGNTWNLNWDAYEGISYGSINLYRGTSRSNMSLLTTIASNLYSYTDLTPPVGSVYYVIGIDVSGGCNPTARTSTFSSILSNIVSNQTTGLLSLSNNLSLALYPNPTGNQLIIDNAQLKMKSTAYIITNVLGQTVQSAICNQQSPIDVSSLSPGLYFVRIAGEKEVWTARFVKE